MLKTEMRNPRTMHLDKMSTKDMLAVMQDETRVAVQAVDAALEDVGKAVDAIAVAMAKGGRLVYVGAGTSGRLGVLDASECPPTFGVPEDRVVGLLAGGLAAFSRAGEPEEDDPAGGEKAFLALAPNANDVVVGISAAGGAKFVLGALAAAKKCGCLTVAVTSNAGSPLDQCADISIVTDTGAEVVTGSTRLKAGTAQKLVLNMISTAVMVKLGNVYENVMVNLKPSNEKLKARMVGIVADLLRVDRSAAEARLAANAWSIRQALTAAQ